MAPAEQVAAYLTEAAGPVPVKKIQKDVAGQAHCRPVEVLEAIAQAERDGKAFAWPRLRGQARYWNRAAGEAIRENVLGIAAEEALPRPALVRRTAKDAFQCGAKAAGVAVKSLIDDKTLRSVRIGGGLLCYPVSNPESLVRGSLAQLRQRLQKLGIDEGLLPGGDGKTESPASPAPVPATEPAQSVLKLSDRLLKEMERLAPHAGFPVTVRSLRSAIPNTDKAEFDSAMLALADQNRIYLTTHDHGWALTEADQRELVWDGAGKLYVAATIRE